MPGFRSSSLNHLAPDSNQSSQAHAGHICHGTDLRLHAIRCASTANFSLNASRTGTVGWGKSIAIADPHVCTTAVVMQVSFSFIQVLSCPCCPDACSDGQHLVWLTFQEVEHKFSKYGRVKEVRIVRNPQKYNESKGFGFVVMDSEDAVHDVSTFNIQTVLTCTSEA